MPKSNAPAIEVLRRVHIDQHFIEVGEWPDSPDCLELRTTGESIGYFGKLNLTLSPDAARQLGHALIDAAEEKGA
jgi:hypothetical protein